MKDETTSFWCLHLSVLNFCGFSIVGSQFKRTIKPFNCSFLWALYEMILRVIQQVFVEHLLCEDAELGVEILEEAGGT